MNLSITRIHRLFARKPSVSGVLVRHAGHGQAQLFWHFDPLGFGRV